MAATGASDDELDGLAVPRMIDYLRARTPEDWHFVCDKLNWDSSVPVIQWILDQQNCDKATAAMMFWRCSPDYYLGFPNRDAVAADPNARFNLDNFDFAMKLVDRWNSGYYSRGTIAFVPEPPNAYVQYQQVAAKYVAQGLPWDVEPDIGQPRQGEDVLSEAVYSRRYSSELAGLLYALGTDIPHPNRMHGSQGTLLGKLKRYLNLD
jgi:hypothetical protein